MKKFQGKTEEEAILAVKEEMGSSAVVMNIKKTKPKGLFSIFKSEVVEVTAALEEKESIPTQKVLTHMPAQPAAKMDVIPEEEAVFEKRLSSIQSMLEQQIKKEEKPNVEEEIKTEQEQENLAFLRLVYNKLIENEVEEPFANQIIGEVEKSLKKEASLDSVLAAVYQKIILKLGEPAQIDVEKGKKKIVFVIGPTGVGKTTTIAKLASELKLTKKLKIGLMTADTYRIAAVEQLRTYANILDIPLNVIYSKEELREGVKLLEDCDIIFVDTAGRSHKNKEQCDELMHLIEAADQCGFEKEICLVLSVTTKYKDLEKICTTYQALGKYKILFTKLDETGAVGNILNISILTGATMSYTTWGQNVPDDINLIDVQSIAKQLLGGVN